MVRYIVCVTKKTIQSFDDYLIPVRQYVNAYVYKPKLFIDLRTCKIIQKMKNLASEYNGMSVTYIAVGNVALSCLE